MMASWERGRPARTKPGPASPISPTWINRERRHAPPSAWPMRFLPTGWLPAASHSSSAATKGTGCGRDARVPRRGSRRSRAARRRLMRWGVDAGRLLRKPPCTLWETPVCRQAGPPPHDGPDHSRVKQVLFQVSRPPTLAGGSFESETTGPYTYREQGPCLANSVGCIIEHRYTG